MLNLYNYVTISHILKNAVAFSSFLRDFLLPKCGSRIFEFETPAVGKCVRLVRLKSVMAWKILVYKCARFSDISSGVDVM